MYSYDDRLRAVQFYIKLGKRAGLTIRQLGYPTKNALRAWHRAYEQRHDLPVASMRTPKYSPTQRKLAVKRHQEMTPWRHQELTPCGDGVVLGSRCLDAVRSPARRFSLSR